MYPRRTFTPVLEVIYEETKQPRTPPYSHYERAIIAQFSYLMC